MMKRWLMLGTVGTSASKKRNLCKFNNVDGRTTPIRDQSSLSGDQIGSGFRVNVTYPVHHGTIGDQLQNVTCISCRCD